MVPTQFASSDPLDSGAVQVRLPRPSRLDAELDIKPPTAAEAAASIGLETVGDLLRHLPRASGEARTIDQLQMEEVATVLVEVRGITSRPVRRPKAAASSREFDASRLAPCTPVDAHSPTA